MIKANFNAYAAYVTDSLYQWDLNQVLSVYGLNLSVVPEVHFSNANVDRAIVKQATMTNHVISVMIPNSLLQDPLTIHAHIGIYEGDTFKVVEKIEIPVIPKKRPIDYRIEDADEEIYSFQALENAIANMVTVAEANAIRARVDNIIAHNNDTEGNAELVDIRIDIDGTVHDSAGGAVRDQFSNLIDKTDLTNNGYERIKGAFAQGGLNSDGTLTEQLYYASHVAPIEYDYDLVLRVKDGYSYAVFKQNDDGKTYSGSSVKTENTIIPKNTKFLLRIQREPVTYSASDPKVFADQIYCESYLGNIGNIATKNRNAINNLKNGLENLKGLFDRGSLTSGDWALWISYRVCTPEKMIYDRKINLVAKDGYMLAVHTFDENGNFTLDTSWRWKYSIEANTPFKIVIKRTTEDTSEIADIEEFVSAVYMNTAIKEDILSDKCNPFKKNYICHGKTPFVGHMGLRIAGDNSILENTISSFKYGGRNGIWAMETDIRETSDGHFVCIHDATLDRTTTGTGNVSEKTLAEIRNFRIKDDNGKATEDLVPTFEEYLSICKMYGTVPLIEIKDITSYAEFFDIIRKYGFMDNAMLTGGLWRLDTIRKYTDDMLYIVLPTETDYSLVYNTIKDHYCVGVSLLYTNETLTEDIIKQMHDHNIFVQLWSINDVEIVKFWFEKGADAIVTDGLLNLD